MPLTFWPVVTDIINDSLPQGKEQTVADPLEFPMAIATMLWIFGVAAMIIYSAVSLATGRRLINGSPLAFGEGNIKERIKNVLNFKKPTVWVIVVSVM